MTTDLEINPLRSEALDRLNSCETTYTDTYYLVLKYLFAALRTSATFAKGDLLDIGCGNKPYRSIFNVKRYLGCDIVQSSQSEADFLCDSLKIAAVDESFDTVISTQVIEHVTEPQILCSEAFRLLRKGGIFIVSGPMYWHLHEEPYDFRRFTKHGFQYLLEKAGFEVIEILPNGGKWALLGQVIIHTIEGTRFRRGILIAIINRLFEWLDLKWFDDVSTSNYVAIARKA